MKNTNDKSSMTGKQFVMDVMEIRRRAREHMEKGAITSTYGVDRDTAIKILNEALATELICVLRYKRHYYMAQGIHSQAVADEFLEHANEETQHADWLATRIVQLGGEPNFDPLGITERSHSQYVECGTLVEMIEENLVAERIAIDSYRAMAQWFGEADSTSRRVIEKILEAEEEHADDLLSLLENIDAGEHLKKVG